MKKLKLWVRLFRDDPFSILFLVKEMFEANDWHLFYILYNATGAASNSLFGVQATEKVAKLWLQMALTNLRNFCKKHILEKRFSGFYSSFARLTWINLCLVPFLFLQVLERPTLRCSPYCGSSDNTWMQQVGHSSDPEIDSCYSGMDRIPRSFFLIKHVQESNWHKLTNHVLVSLFFCTVSKKTADSDLFMSFGQVSTTTPT